jgi:hypothetical protein
MDAWENEHYAFQRATPPPSSSSSSDERMDLYCSYESETSSSYSSSSESSSSSYDEDMVSTEPMTSSSSSSSLEESEDYPLPLAAPAPPPVAVEEDEYPPLLILPDEVLQLIAYEGLNNDRDRIVMRLVNLRMTRVIPVQQLTLENHASFLRREAYRNANIGRCPSTKLTDDGPGPSPFTLAEREAMPPMIQSSLHRLFRPTVTNRVRLHAGVVEDIGLDVTLSDFMDLIIAGFTPGYRLNNALREGGYCGEREGSIYSHRCFSELVKALLPGFKTNVTAGNITTMVRRGLAVWVDYRDYINLVVDGLVSLENMKYTLLDRMGFIHPNVVYAEWMKIKEFQHNFTAFAMDMLRGSPLPVNSPLLEIMVRKSNPFHKRLPGPWSNLRTVHDIPWLGLRIPQVSADSDSDSEMDAPQPPANDPTPKRAGEPLENDDPPKRQRREEDDEDDVNVRV